MGYYPIMAKYFDTRKKSLFPFFQDSGCNQVGNFFQTSCVKMGQFSVIIRNMERGEFSPIPHLKDLWEVRGIYDPDIS